MRPRTWGRAISVLALRWHVGIDSCCVRGLASRNHRSRPPVTLVTRTRFLYQAAKKVVSAGREVILSS
jgi:hypothetical protein